jgi:TIR domain
MKDGAPPRVFISYSQDTEAHKKRVLELADRLRADGIDANVDQYVPFPPEGWSGWCEAEVDRADFVLMVCTETYLRRFNRKEAAGVGHGVIWEARLIRTLLNDEASASSKFVPVLFCDEDRSNVPLALKDAQSQRVDTEEGYERLYRLLTGQPHIKRPELGGCAVCRNERRRSGRFRRARRGLPFPSRILGSMMCLSAGGQSGNSSQRRCSRRTGGDGPLWFPAWRGWQVVPGGSLLLGEYGALPWRLSAAGARPRQSRQHSRAARNRSRPAEIAGRRQ